MSSLYTHERDEIDDMARALTQMAQKEGKDALWKQLPDGSCSAVNRLMQEKGVGLQIAIEILLRTMLLLGEDK